MYNAGTFGTGYLAGFLRESEVIGEIWRVWRVSKERLMECSALNGDSKCAERRGELIDLFGAFLLGRGDELHLTSVTLLNHEKLRL